MYNKCTPIATGRELVAPCVQPYVLPPVPLWEYVW